MEKEKIITAALLIIWIGFFGWKFSDMNYRADYEINGFRRAYLGSQYTGGAGLIPDNTVFAYAAGAYLNGENPLKVNPEMPPLGKYILSLSVLFFDNLTYAIVISAIAALLSMIWLGKLMFGRWGPALLPVILFSLEKLFWDQFQLTPMLDIIQLPFIFLSFYFFIRAVNLKKNVYYAAAGLALGFVASIKVMITAILIGISWSLYALLTRKMRALLNLIVITAPFAFGVLVVSYLRILVDNYSLWYFLLVQKWVLLYQGSKIQFPFSAWRLIFLNQWQAWWGDYSILKTDDWRITWPIITILSLAYIIIKIVKKIRWKPVEQIIAIWIIAYSAFISIGTISTRHLLPFLPFLYLLSMRFLVMLKSKYAT